jgi:hypothetical protein
LAFVVFVSVEPLIRSKSRAPVSDRIDSEFLRPKLALLQSASDERSKRGNRFNSFYSGNGTLRTEPGDFPNAEDLQVHHITNQRSKKMIKKMKVIVFATSIILCLSALAFGQERFGAVEGTVKDSTGAVVPNATVRLQGNAFDRTVTSDSEGFFRVQQVPPGTNYTITIGAGNFKPFVQNNIIVQLGQSTPIDSALSTTVEAVVEVTADDGIASIDATTSKIQTNLDARKLETLPKGNNFTTALKAAAPYVKK